MNEEGSLVPKFKFWNLGIVIILIFSTIITTVGVFYTFSLFPTTQCQVGQISVENNTTAFQPSIKEVTPQTTKNVTTFIEKNETLRSEVN